MFEKLKQKTKISKIAEKNLAGALLILLLCAFYYPQWHKIIAVKADYSAAQTANAAEATDNSNSDSSSSPKLPTAAKPANLQTVQDANPQEDPPKIDAREALVFDASSNQDLFSNNPDQQVEIASLTKLMTAVVAIKNPDFNKPITITKQDQLSVEPSLHLQAGDQVMPADLLKAMLVGSANDAALALANHFPGYDSFVANMNNQAQVLDMSNTHYSTAIGFDDSQNYSTASDLKKLVNYALRILPYEEIWQDNSYAFISVNGTAYKIENSNILVAKHPNIKSIKTGLTPQAQGNMIVLANNKSGDKVISIVLNSTAREKDTMAVIDYIFKKFSWNS